MHARIYRPARSAMTSGMRNTRRWVLEYVQAKPKTLDPLMGWTGSGDTRGQVRLSFESRDDAVAYAEKHGIAYTVEEPQSRAPNVRPQGYAATFAHDRRGAWTH